MMSSWFSVTLMDIHKGVSCSILENFGGDTDSYQCFQWDLLSTLHVCKALAPED